MTDPGTTPVTRRELRLTEREARRPLAPIVAPPQPRRARHAVQHSRVKTLLTGGTLVLAVTLITGSVSHARLQAVRAAALHDQVVATAVALRAEHTRQARSASATEVRLASAAAAYAAARRGDALASARAAVEAGGALVSTAAPVVSPQELSPLDEAIAQLAVLIDTAPEPQVIVAAAATELRPSTLPVGSATVHDGALGVQPRTDSTPEELGTDLTVVATLTPVLPRVLLTEPEVVATPTADPGATAPTAGPLAPPAAPSMPDTRAPADILELALSAEIVAATAQVNELSVQVQAVAQANIAAAEAAARAAEERAAAARRVAAEVARKVDIAKDAANGAIPTDVLCAVSFDADTLIRCDAVASLEDLNRAFRAQFGKSMSIDSSYRDYATQVVTKAARGGLAAAAGTSNHGRALAIDIAGMGGVGQFDLPTYRWMKANAPLYGWYHPPYMEPGGAGPMEPWHWEFGKL